MGSDHSLKGKHNLFGTENQQGQRSELCANVISCASGELNKTVDGSGAEGDVDVRESGTVSWRGCNLEGGADGRPTIKQLL